MRLAVIAVVTAGMLSQAAAECANACSGHGICRNSDQCNCFPNYAAADCSQRVCPFGLAWVDNPRGDLNHDGVRGTKTAATPGETDPSLANGMNMVPVSDFMNGDSLGAMPYHAQAAAFTHADEDTDFVTEVNNQFDVTPFSDQKYQFVKYDWESYNPAAQEGEAHFYSECSNKGLCDRASGLCVCFDGYTGSSCQRSTCPNQCSGHGVCRTVDEVALGDNTQGTVTSVDAGTISSPTGVSNYGLNRRKTDNRGGVSYWSGITSSQNYRLWDQDMAQTCVCDPGFTGADCSRRECPRGDDPLTHRAAECGGADCIIEKQVFTITFAATTDAEWFHIRYTDWTGKIWKTDNFLIGGAGVTDTARCDLLPLAYTTKDNLITFANTANNAAAAISAEDIVKDQDVSSTVWRALTGIPNGVFEDVRVTSIWVVANLAYTVKIEFTKNPGNLERLEWVHDTDMQTNLPPCGTAGTATVASLALGTAVDSSMDGNKEESTCANRGICDYDTGLCKCFKGYYGDDCATQNALAQ